jgi:DedD protein
MDQGLKERLIGAAVLVALGVWLIPWLLDGRQEQVELATSSSAVRLPAPDGPLPVRQQTLSLDAAKSDPVASEPRPDAAETAATAVVAEAAVAAAEPTSTAPSPTSTAPSPAPENAPAPKQLGPKPAADHTATAPQRVATATPPPSASKPVPKPAASASAAASPQAVPARGDWAVQFGSFGAEDNAKKLAQKVNAYGYKPEVSSIRASGKALYRVRLGPYKSRAEADATASALSAHGFSPQVVAAD